jgi:hypothetical protein
MEIASREFLTLNKTVELRKPDTVLYRINCDEKRIVVSWRTGTGPRK